MDFVYVTLDGVYNYSKSALSRLENDFALLNLIMRESCLTRIYPYSSKSFMAFSGSLKLSVNSYSEKKRVKYGLYSRIPDNDKCYRFLFA